MSELQLRPAYARVMWSLWTLGFVATAAIAWWSFADPAGWWVRVWQVLCLGVSCVYMVKTAVSLRRLVRLSNRKRKQ